MYFFSFLTFGLIYLIFIVKSLEIEPTRDELFDDSQQLFDKLKSLEEQVAGKINQLNLISNSELLEKSIIFNDFDIQFEKELEPLQIFTQQQLLKGFSIENCTHEITAIFDKFFTNQKTMPSILFLQYQTKQDDIVTNYTTTMETLYQNGISNFTITFLNITSLSGNELQEFNGGLDGFLNEFEVLSQVEFTAAQDKITKTTKDFEIKLKENIIEIQQQTASINELFKNCVTNQMF